MRGATACRFPACSQRSASCAAMPTTRLIWPGCVIDSFLDCSRNLITRAMAGERSTSMNRSSGSGLPGAASARQSGPPTGDERLLQYKKELHQQLITSLNLSTVGTMDEKELRLEVRRAAEE